MSKTKGATHDLAIEMLEAIRDVGLRHKLDPRRSDDCGTLVVALGAVLIGLVQVSDPAATGVTARQEVRAGKRGTGVMVHHDEH